MSNLTTKLILFSKTLNKHYFCVFGMIPARLAKNKFMKKLLLAFCLSVVVFGVTFCNSSDSSDTKLFERKILKTEDYFYKKKALYDIHAPEIQQKINALDCYFSRRVDTFGFNGAVLINYKGIPILEGYYGYSNYYQKIKLNKKSTFQIASTSKTFTSGAILILFQEGYLDIDDTLQTFFPNFPYKGITVRMLLNHRSGLPNYLNFSESYWVNKSNFMTNEDVLNQLIKFKPKALATPNTRFFYNNTNYVLLSLIIERVSGYTYSQFLEKFIFHPLGMYDSHVFNPKKQLATEVIGYKGRSWTQDKIVYTDGVVGDKGIYSTVLDLYKWDQALYAGKIISKEIINLAYTPQSFETFGFKNYGLGWRMHDQPDGTRLIYHNGWWHSFNSVFNRKISDGTSIIILSSHYSQSVYKIQEIWNILYGNSSVTLSNEE